MKRLCVLTLLLLQLCFSFVWAENFPKPTILQADIDFWLRVYTEADTRNGYIHDSKNLSVVYEKISIKGGPRANKKHIKATKAKYAKILKSLASGKRTNLTKDERHVLSLWGEAVANKRLKAAANDIRFQRGQSDRFLKGLERSGEWRAYIEKTFTDMSLPVELSILPHVESSFNPDAYSHVGAAGLWQFIRSTGKRYMQIDHIIDERLDPFASTIAAAKLLRHNYQLTQSWPLALTAYNHGVASMRRAINKLGTRDIAIIARKYKGRAFGFASRNFYVAFLAALEVDTNPQKYFSSVLYAKPVDYQTVTLDSYYFVKDIAEHLNISKSHIKRHNRALRDSVWSNTKRIPKGYKLRLPKSLFPKTDQLLASIPNELRYKEQTPDEFHIIQRGDTVSEIANEYGYKVKDILAVNNMDRGNYIRAGQKLRLPVKGTQVKNDIKVAAVEKAIIKKPLANSSTKEIEASQQLKQAEKNLNKDLNAIDKDNVNSEALNSQLDVSVVAEPQFDGKETAVLLTDPADYTVDNKDTIEVQAAETLGHYADWLDIRASRLRQINNLRFAEPVVMGKRIKLDFTEINPQQFESRRIAYQKQLQGQFFSKYRIESTSEYQIKPGESVWVLALRKFKVPIWLLHQHNPDVDFNRVKPGIRLIVPSLKEVNRPV